MNPSNKPKYISKAERAKLELEGGVVSDNNEESDA